MAKSPVAPKMTTVSLLEDVSFIEAGLDLISGRKPPDAVETESQEPARARGDAVSSMDRDFDGRVAGLKCWDVLLLSVFSAKAAILSGSGYGRLAATRSQLLQIERLWCRFLQFFESDPSRTAEKVCKHSLRACQATLSTRTLGLAALSSLFEAIWPALKTCMKASGEPP